MLSPLVAITDSTFDRFDLEEAILQPLGCRLDARQSTTTAETSELVRDADFVLTQFARVNREVIGEMRRARLIVRYGIGVDNVDIQAAREHGIPVCNVPDYCIDEVADHTVALILSATRQVSLHSRRTHEGRWGLAVPIDNMRTLSAMTIGVIGFGRIGRQVVRRLNGFGCRVLVHDPAVTPESVKLAGADATSLDALWPSSDLVTLHCPSGPQTRHLINEATLSRMKPGAILVNVGRGDLVDPPALIRALRSRQISIVALDVWDPEPPRPDDPLLTLENVILTPHVASVSAAAVRRLRQSVAESVARVVRGESLVNVVNGVTTPRQP
jgi:D-3-phosphoglycerate dehydrogenase